MTIPEKKRAMLEKAIGNLSLGAADHFSSLEGDLVLRCGGKTARRKRGLIMTPEIRRAFFLGSIDPEMTEAGHETLVNLLIRVVNGRELVPERQDNGIGQLFGVQDRPSAGRPADHIDMIICANLIVDGIRGLMISEGDAIGFPGIDPHQGWIFGPACLE